MYSSVNLRAQARYWSEQAMTPPLRLSRLPTIEAN